MGLLQTLMTDGDKLRRVLGSSARWSAVPPCAAPGNLRRWSQRTVIHLVSRDNSLTTYPRALGSSPG